ncbi:MAG: hypothetical protein R3F56_00025 [Planctomycetota bacterium]
MRAPVSRRLVAVLAAIPPCAAAQATVTIPAEYADREAPYVMEAAGFSQAFRQQIMLRADELAGLRGHALTSLTFRRDVQLPVPLRSGVTNVVVTLSEGAPHPSTASPLFADNRGPEPREVFRGELTLPASPAPSRPPTPSWADPQAVEIAFATPFEYHGGHLCIEIDGRPVPGKQPPAWPIDATTWSVGGATTFVGRSCDQRLQAMVILKDPTPGSSLTLFASGPAQTIAVCLLGTELGEPLQLTHASRSNPFPCQVHVAPFAVPGYVFPRVKLEQITRVEMALPLPLETCLFSRTLAVQWLQMPNLETGIGMASTHLQTVRLADHMHSYPGAMVRSGIAPPKQFPEKGEVFQFQMPVLRLGAR